MSTEYGSTAPRPLTYPLELREGGNVESISANMTLSQRSAQIQTLTPTGAARDVTLPAEAEVSPAGRMYWIINAADASENLVIKDDGGATIATANQNESALVYNAGQSGGTESSWVLVAVVAIALS